MPDSSDSPPSVDALYEGVERALNTPYANGESVGNCQWGVYLFYDYDGEPIYVGQTRERIRTRIRRHLTNQRTDAVAMNVLDPFEVAEIEMWPFWQDPGDLLDRAEYTIYCKALEESEFSAVLNERVPPKADLVRMPESVRVSILPDGETRGEREHPDIRLARRARTIANLARVISERKVQPGIRQTLWAQAKRLEALAKQRLDAFMPDAPKSEGFFEPEPRRTDIR
ncbi:MAG: GIY-YIG nuclease family protein [Gammaproteobacteria bacterium]|nr:GIY-YIG nuclease family protein [Gammaproteobacteria bacterium]